MFYKLDESCVQFPLLGIEILGNPLTGDLFGLTENGAKLASILANGSEIDKEKLSSDEAVLLEELMKRGLVNQKVVGRQLRAAYLHVTSRCNMRCSGCYSQSNHTVSEQDYLGFSEIALIADKLKAANVSTVVISGGEPFLREDIIQIINYLKKTAMINRVTCITNGLATPELYFEAGKSLDCLSFSLDGFCFEHSTLRKGSFDRIIALIPKLKQAGVNVSVIFTLHKQNYKCIPQMRELASSLNIGYNFSIFTVPHSNETEYLELNSEDIDYIITHGILHNTIISDSPLDGTLGCKTCCGAGKTLISIMSDGSIMPCHMFFEKQFSLGNALTDDISHLLSKSNRPFFDLDRKEKCRSCEYKYICGGGCLFRSYVSTGKLEGTDPLCSLYSTGIKQTLLSLTQQ